VTTQRCTVTPSITFDWITPFWYWQHMDVHILTNNIIADVMLPCWIDGLCKPLAENNTNHNSKEPKDARNGCLFSWYCGLPLLSLKWESTLAWCRIIIGLQWLPLLYSWLCSPWSQSKLSTIPSCQAANECNHSHYTPQPIPNIHVPTKAITLQ